MTDQHKLPHGSPDVVNVNDEQLQLEMRVLAELLLDIYEYHVQTEHGLKRDDQNRELDSKAPHFNMKERS